MENLFIRTAPIARKYELLFHSENNSFEIIFKREYLDMMRDMEGLWESVQKTTEKLNFKKSWNFDSDVYFGYDRCMKITLLDGGMVSVAGVVTKKTGLAVTHTLEIVLSIFGYVIDNQVPQPGEPEQEMILRTTCSFQSEFYGAAMHADLSTKFSIWLYNQTDELPAMVNSKIYDAMAGLLKKLFNMNPYKHQFDYLCGHGFLLQPPLSIYTCQFGILREEEGKSFDYRQRIGYDTFCHNLDYWQQQLVLLAGFCTLCQIFRSTTDPEQSPPRR